ncbi:hypothetical protein CR513_55546, partial [Mucuna pruriens]
MKSCLILKNRIDKLIKDGRTRRWKEGTKPRGTEVRLLSKKRTAKGVGQSQGDECHPSRNNRHHNQKRGDIKNDGVGIKVLHLVSNEDSGKATLTPRPIHYFLECGL